MTSFPIEIQANSGPIALEGMPGFVIESRNLEADIEAYPSPQPGDRAAGDGLPKKVIEDVELKELGTMEVKDNDPFYDVNKNISIFAKAELLEEQNMIVYTDEDGLVSLHFPEALDSSPDHIDLDGEVRKFSIDLRKPTEVAKSGDRGTFGVLEKKILKVIGWKGFGKAVGKYGPKAIRAWETKHRPTRMIDWGDDFFNKETLDFESLIPPGKNEEKTLLFIHGTASRLSAAFHGLDNNDKFKARIHAFYGGRIYGYDHPTLATGIATNVMQLYEKLAPGKHLLDIISHSRGGPLSRAFRELDEKQLKAAFLKDSERGNYEKDLIEWGKQWRIPEGVEVVIDRIIFAGATNNGTTLAKKGHLKKYIELMLTLANLLPDGADIAVDILLSLAKTLVGDILPVMPGLDDQSPESELFGKLKLAPSPDDAAIAANFEPEKALKAVADEILDKLFEDRKNDMVVPSNSVSQWKYGNSIEKGRLLFFGEDREVWHSTLFAQEESSNFILDKLGA